MGKKIFRVPAPYFKNNNSFCLLRRSTKNIHDLWQPIGGILWCDVRQKRLKIWTAAISGQSVPAPLPGNARRRSASFDRTTMRFPVPHFVARPVPQCCWSSWSHWGFQYDCRACDTRTEGTLFRWALKTRSRGRHDPLSASGRFQRKGKTLKKKVSKNVSGHVGERKRFRFRLLLPPSVHFSLFAALSPELSVCLPYSPSVCLSGM